MRTTIDVPDDLMKRTKSFLAERNMTFRTLVIDAIEQVLAAPAPSFKLRDASVGWESSDGGVSAEVINQAIDAVRASEFRP